MKLPMDRDRDTFEHNKLFGNCFVFFKIFSQRPAGSATHIFFLRSFSGKSQTHLSANLSSLKVSNYS